MLTAYNSNENSARNVRDVVKKFVSKCIQKWKASHRNVKFFLQKNENWLKKEIKFEKVIGERGRPKKSFSVSSQKTKSRNVMSLLTENTVEKLCFATEKCLVKNGKRSAAEVVKLAVGATPQELKNMKLAHALQSPPTKICSYSAEEALGLMIDCDLGKEQYINIQRGAKKRGANIYPPYNVISVAKKHCYPQNILITETEARIPLKNLLELTVQRLTQIQSEVLERVRAEVSVINIIYKWGLDGSGGHSIFKQNFSNGTTYGDSHIILSTIVPLEMFSELNNVKQIYWKNLKPSSTKYCRPIGFRVQKETPENMKNEYELVESEISKLELTKISIGKRVLFFKHTVLCTMLDGKTCNVLTETSSTQTCNICKVSPKEINDLTKVVKRKCNVDAYKFGISVLHCFLRVYEFLLHISYKLDIKQWQARGPQAKESVKNRKTIIANRFYAEMGLVVDQPKQGGGNSNDGNTARKFFENPEKVADITGLDENLIKRFSNILSTMASGYCIQVEPFKVYCFDTAKLCVSVYGWYNMSATVHKILIHGGDIIESLPLPVGQLSEDVLEASHKCYKTIRQYHSRKTSRIHTNTDILHMLLVASDPVISAHRRATKIYKKPFPQEVLNLLKAPDFLTTAIVVPDESDEDTSSSE